MMQTDGEKNTDFFLCNNNLALYMFVDSQHYKSYKGENYMHVDERWVQHQFLILMVTGNFHVTYSSI